MAFAIIAIVFFTAIMFGLHIKTVYAGFVASTNVGDPLFEREVLEGYGDKLISELVGQNVKAAIVSRSGQPRENLPKGIMFTHSAFFLSAPNADGAPNYDVYNLYHGEDNRLISSLVTDTPADFLKLLREKDAGIILPTPAAQNALFDYIKSPLYGAVHQQDYSLISNPLDIRFQNCNEFMLDTLAAMIWGTTDPALIKGKYQGVLKPAEINVSFLRRHIGPLVDERLIMADQGKPILTPTSQTLAGFLESQGRLEKSYVLNFED